VTQGGSVTPERFARVRAIFEAALERAAADRRGYVDGACARDEGLRRDVQAMLSAEAKDDPMLDPSPVTPTPSAPEEGRFPVGTVLAGRYRILGLLGKGGMGEVYKAFDLILNQTVALKFLNPAHISEAALIRFRNEVRIARQVSHPNVCRVYDLGMVEGLHFLSMEYIDGEDLASLLRRIGRLPQDKAIEFTRKICAGLGAAHERGVLHRDLKPANIMIDGRGQVRITDFGLAALAAEIPLSDLRSGTPAYMSPEQKAGKDVTTRSDLYSLGLVLHEMFTGKARKDTQSSPSEIVKELDPAIERLILRCLEEDPKRRPQSALNAAMALPGADPIAAALAAGETPSPEMVAASGEKEGFSARTAWLCFAGVVVSTIFITFLVSQTSLLRRAPLDIPPEVLTFRAQEMLKQLGYVEKPRSTASGFIMPDETFWEKLQGYDPARREAILASHRPPVILFWYRQHHDLFIADRSQFPEPPGAVTDTSPANTEPGMIGMALDPAGRLVALEARPPASRGAATRAEPDWNALLVLAGLDPARFTPAPPLATPPMAVDSAMAWTGTYTGERPEQVRVEAAAWQGRPVFFTFATEQSAPAAIAGPLTWVATMVSVLSFAGMFAGGMFLARRNLRLGRSDRRGAGVVAGVAFICLMLSWSLTANHVAALWEFRMLILAVGVCGSFAGFLWLTYLAIEPHVRRHWPDSLISWTRLATGRQRDPLIASHVLAGIVASNAVRSVSSSVVEPLPVPRVLANLSNPAFAAQELLTGLALSLGVLLGVLILVVLLRLLVRRMWIADLLGALLMAPALAGPANLIARPYLIPLVIAIVLTFLWLLRRFGVVAAWAAYFVSFPFGIPFLPSSWYSGRVLIVMLAPVALSAWALWVILSAQKRPSTESAA
jgi:serine/threonine-protein kinase